MPDRHCTNERRNESRYPIANRLLEALKAGPAATADYTTGFTATARTLFVRIERPSAPKSGPLFGRILDLSPNGTRLSIDVPLKPDERVVLAIQPCESNRNSAVTAKVCWLGVIAQGELHVGCAFESVLSEQALAKLATDGFLERRREERHPTSIVAYARRNSESQARIRVHMENFSVGGFALFSPQPFTVGEHLTLELPFADSDGVTVSAIVVRRNETDGGYFLGCQLVNKQDYHVICRIAPQNMRHVV